MSVEFLYSALDTPLGIKVRTSDPERFRQRLYAARREAPNPDFESLAFVIVGPDELWIVRKGVSPSAPPER